MLPKSEFVNNSESFVSTSDSSAPPSVTHSLPADLTQSPSKLGELLQTLIERLPGGAAFVMDCNLRYLLAGGEAIAKLGMTSRDFVGKSLVEVHGPEFAQQYEPQYKRALGGTPFLVEHISYGGYFQTHGIPLRDATDKVYAVMSVSYDITDRKRTKNALRESKAQIAADLAGMRRLYDLQAKLADQTDVKAALRDVLAVACEFTNTDRGCVQLISDDGNRLEMAVWQGYTDDSPFIEFFRYEGFEQGCEVARVYRQRMIIEDTVGFEGLYDTEAGAAAQAEGIRATQSTPMTNRSGETIGVISTQFRQPHRSTEHELRLVDMLAWTAAEFLERHRTDAALRHSEERYRSLYNSMDEGYYIFEVLFDQNNKPLDLLIQDANPAFEKLTGLRQAVGKTMRELVPTVEVSWIEQYGMVALTGEPRRFGGQAAGLDSHWYEGYAFRLGDAQSRLVAVIFNDITERKHREANGTFLAEIADDLSLLSTAKEIMETVGAKIEAYLRVKSCLFVNVNDERGEVHVFDAWNSDEVPSLRDQTIRLADFINEEFSQANRTGEGVVVRNTHTDPRSVGGNYDALGLGAFITVPFHQNGVWTNYLAVTDSQPRDWRDDEIELFRELAHRVLPRLARARVEAALRQSEEQLRIVLDSITEHAIITNDTKGMITSWNPGAQEVFGWTADEMIGQSVNRLFTPEDRVANEPEREMATAREQGKAVCERDQLCKDGSKLYVSGVMSPLYDATGHLMGYVKVARDLTERQQMEQTLRVADRRKDEFLAMLAHELRNPLAPIRNVLKVLEMTREDDETIGTAVALMSRQVDHLVRLIDDLLDVSRIRRGKIELRREQLDFTALVQQAAEATRPLYAKADRQLQVSLPLYPIYLYGDATRLTQVITNLLTNGIRYTHDNGHVSLVLEVTNDLLGQPVAMLRVRDDGIGLAPDQTDQIFELFVQVDNSLARSQGGLGVGLTLVKKIVDMHGGRVEAGSDGLGQGSEFVITLPIRQERNKPMPTFDEKTANGLTGHTILVVDDNGDAADTLAMLLRLQKHRVHVRYSGREAVEAIQSLQPKVILLDIGMPELDGFETCRLIRQQPGGNDIVLFALTGYGQEEDKRRSTEAGFNGHFVKPIDLKALAQMLDNLPFQPEAD